MKLVHYISKRYLIYSAVISIVAIPLFYVSIQLLLLRGLDEGMRQQKTWIEKKLHTISPENFTSFDNNVEVKPSESTEIKEEFVSQPVFVEANKETVTHRILKSNIEVNGKFYTIKIQKSMIEDEDLLKNLLLLQFIFIVLLIVGSGFINFFISKKLWLPFNDIVRKMKNYRIDHSEKLNFIPTKIAEFKDLEASINELVNRNSKLYKAQKEFTENASHELQTPIAVFSSKLELLMQTTPISEEQAGLIGDIFSAGEKMQRINRTLLLLTKIENNQFPAIEKVNINEVFGNILEQYNDILQLKNITLKVISGDRTEVSANPILIDILFGNLISNAIKYSEEGKRITVEISKKSVCVSNEAQNGLGKLNEAELFQRFKKQSNNSRSLGLGLEICKKICNLYHYSIVYDFKNHEHCFTVGF